MKTSIPPCILYITLIFCFVLSVISQSCKEAPSVTYRIKDLDTTIEAIKVPISKLAIDYKKYHGKYVETTGRFYFQFENVAIFKEKELFQDEQDGFWVSWLSELNLDDQELNKMNGKLVTVKGKIDTTEKGHMGQYFATIREIYFWK